MVHKLKIVTQLQHLYTISLKMEKFALDYDSVLNFHVLELQ